jgi:hypothetical protein
MSLSGIVECGCEVQLGDIYAVAAQKCGGPAALEAAVSAGEVKVILAWLCIFA